MTENGYRNNTYEWLGLSSGVTSSASSLYSESCRLSLLLVLEVCRQPTLT